MSTFARTSFNSKNYNSFRPQYPPSFYQILANYIGDTPVERAIDLGCGTGVATYPMLNLANEVTGLDLSPSMIATANNLREKRLQELGVADSSRVEFMVSAVEDFEAAPGSFDLITAAECIHWFKDYDSFFAAAARQLKPGGTLAYWYYVDPEVVDFQGPSNGKYTKDETRDKVRELYNQAVYLDETGLGPYWEQPGRGILQRELQEPDSKIPSDLFCDVKVQKFAPGRGAGLTADDLQLEKRGISLADYMGYFSTFSAMHAYDEATGKGEEFMRRFSETCVEEFGWHPEHTKLDLQWISGYTFMKKRG